MVCVVPHLKMNDITISERILLISDLDLTLIQILCLFSDLTMTEKVVSDWIVS